MWKGKHKVIIANGQQFLHAVIQPFFPVFILTVGAMSVSAAVVGLVGVGTLVAVAIVRTQCTALAYGQQIDDPFLLTFYFVFTQVLLAVIP